MANLPLDGLNGVDDHSDGPVGQGLERLLRVDVHTRQPAAKARVAVVPGQIFQSKQI